MFQPKSQAKVGGWLPTDISGCKLWLDFSDANFLYTDAGSTKVSNDGDKIYQANDKSGNGYHAVQATVDYRPLYKSGIKNGLSVGNFDGYDQLIISNFTVDGDWTIFNVFKDTKTYTTGVMCMAELSESVRGFVMRPYDNSTFRVYAYNTTPTAIIATVPIDRSNYWIVTGKAASDYITAYANGNAGTPVNTVGTLNTITNTVRIGSSFADNNYLYGNICEILYYDSALSDTDRQTVETYLNDKWAIY